MDAKFILQFCAHGIETSVFLGVGEKSLRVSRACFLQNVIRSQPIRNGIRIAAQSAP